MSRKQLIIGMIVTAALKALLTAGLILIAVFGCGCVDVSHTGGQKMDVYHHHEQQKVHIDVDVKKHRRRQP